MQTDTYFDCFVECLLFIQRVLIQNTNFYVWGYNTHKSDTIYLSDSIQVISLVIDEFFVWCVFVILFKSFFFVRNIFIFPCCFYYIFDCLISLLYIFIWSDIVVSAFVAYRLKNVGFLVRKWIYERIERSKKLIFVRTFLYSGVKRNMCQSDRRKKLSN